jgi:NADPH-dependent 2,4-dienoyl-CoA reductase/sulfur reductase-like enzyme
MHVIIVGAGAAGTSAAETIRKYDKDSEITVINEENELPYSPVALPEYIEGKISREQLFLWDNDFVKKMSINYLSGKSVVNVNSHEKKVVLDDGTSLSYDKLLIASGASPVLTEDLVNRKGVFTLRTIRDAETIRHHIKERAVIYGAGAVAVKIAVALHNIGVDIIMVCRSRVLRRLFDEDICQLIHDLLIANGIKIIGVHDQMRVFGDPIESLSIATQRIRIDGVIAALGVNPNTQFLNGQNIHFGSSRGIIVNEKMETSAANIYAAGDCTETQDVTSGKRYAIALWPPAVKQGEVAALNMLGMNAVYEGTLPGNVIDVFNTVFASIGSLDGEKIDIKKHGGIIRFTIKKEKLIGAQLIGDIDSAGLISSYIIKGIDAKHLDYLKIIPSGKLRFNDSSLSQQHHMKSNDGKALCC